jgi:hypothetical protein
MPGMPSPLPGIRVYPFTHEQIGFGFLLETDGIRDTLFLAPESMSPGQSLQCLIASYRHLYPSETPPYVFLVDEGDPLIPALDELMACWLRLFPNAPPEMRELPVGFITGFTTKAEILEAVNDVLSAWGQEHPGEAYPRSVTEATEH